MPKLVQGSNYDEGTGGEVPVVSMEEFMSMQAGHKSKAEPIVPSSDEPVAYESRQEPNSTTAPERKDGGSSSSKQSIVGIVKNRDIKKLTMVIGVIVLLMIILVGARGLFTKEDSKEDEAGEYVPPWMDENYVSPAFSYTAAEVAELRLNGYTGREIENYEVAETPAGILIEQATKARKELYDREIAPYMDSASEEYKELAANSWVGQDELIFSKDISGYSRYTDVMNVDYEKLPARGMQLYVKLVTAKGSVMFMNVTPEQYVRLSDSGNIVVNVSYTKTSDGAVIVTSITEVNITQ